MTRGAPVPLRPGTPKGSDLNEPGNGGGPPSGDAGGGGSRADASVRVHRPAATEAEVRERHAANRAGWNEGAAHYTAEVDDTIEFLRSGRSNLHPLERANLGDLSRWCGTAIHLQCASGRDTLSLLNEGVKRVVGIDISDVHIENARRTSEALGAAATWHRCDVLDSPAELDGTADLVYTGRGALCWLHDLPAWGRVVARLLEPGGVFHVLDDHPVTSLFALDAPVLTASGLPYFDHAESSVGWPAAYIGELDIPREKLSRKHERLWTLGEIHGAVRDAGLVVERLGEHPDEYWTSFPALPEAEKRKIPLTFTLLARKPR